MDTGTHLVFGFGLAGLAYIDPVVAADPAVSTAVLIGTIVGSQMPDSDGLLRFKGNATYIKNHRGASHSLPMLIAWTMLITYMLSLAFAKMPILHVGLWVLIAVCLHVFTDLFNTYGTQALRPFTEKWIGWNIIHIFDPFIFMSHLLAIFLWVFHLERPETIFPVLYGIIAAYYIWRSSTHYILERGLPGKDAHHQAGDRYYLLPTINLHVWNVVKRHVNGTYNIGEWKNQKLKWVDQIASDQHLAAEASKRHPDIAAFLYYSSFACAEVKALPWGYEVRWADVRYRHRKQYPFVAVLQMDHQYQPLGSYVGWVSESRLEKKLRMDT